VTELVYKGAFELGSAIARGDYSSREVLSAHIERVDRLNPTLNAIVAQNLGLAEERAKAADEATGMGEVWGPLHGVPLTIKDSFEVVGMATTSGSLSMADHKADSDAVAVARLIDAGAIVYAKTNLPEWADDLQSYNELFGTTVNPWDTTKTPGGSSGGSAASVAAGFSSLELGSDIGGSIRNPAAFCGVYGHKPSFGIVPMWGHIPGPPGMKSQADIAVAGPLARTANDLEKAMDLLAGPDPWEGPAWRVSIPAARAETLEELRIGVWFDSPLCPLSTGVRAVLESAVDELIAVGANIDPSAHPDIDPAATFFLYQQLMYGQAASGFPSQVRREADARYDDLDSDDQSRHAMMLRGVGQRHRHWLAVNERRQRLRGEWDEWFENYDLLLTPVMPTTAFAHDHSPKKSRTIEIDGEAFDYWAQMYWAGLTGAVYLPSTIIPIGPASDGMPVGMQVIAPYLQDRTALRFAELVEPILGGFEAPPLS